MVWRRIYLLKGGCCHELEKSGRLSPSKLLFSDNEQVRRIEMRFEPSGLLCKHCTAAVHLLCDRRRLLWIGTVWATSAGISNVIQNFSSRCPLGKHLPEQQNRRAIFITCGGGVILFETILTSPIYFYDWYCQCVDQHSLTYQSSCAKSWILCLITVRTINYHMSRVRFYGKDRGEVLERLYCAIPPVDPIDLWAVGIPSAPEIFPSAMWYVILPAWVPPWYYATPHGLKIEKRTVYVRHFSTWGISKSVWMEMIPTSSNYSRHCTRKSVRFWLKNVFQKKRRGHQKHTRSLGVYWDHSSGLQAPHCVPSVMNWNTNLSTDHRYILFLKAEPHSVQNLVEIFLQNVVRKRASTTLAFNFM